MPGHVSTADRRRLEVLVTGPDDGFPMLFHHGTPQSAVPFAVLDRPAAARNLRVVSYSRPGYGESTPRPDAADNYRIMDDVEDVTAVLDALDIDEFVTLGWSGGGPRALACAALMRGRCRAATSGAGIAPVDLDGLDLLAGMGQDNIDELGAAMEGPEAIDAWLTENGLPLFGASPDQIAEALGELLPDVDKAAVTGELAEYLAAASAHAGAQGIVGWRDDDLALVRPWGFDLASVETPVSVWQGGQDRMVPYAHGVALAKAVPNARSHLYEQEGHISLLMQVDKVLDDLIDLARL